MQSKRISLQKAQTHTVSAAETDIDVPEGKHTYIIKQKSGERNHSFHLRHESSEVSVIGLVHAKNSEEPILHTAVVHHSPHTKAETLIKTLSEDKAAPRFTGMIRIEPGSNGCESYLNHHSLLIGEKAASWTTPSLEILNNEVKCSHAATIRTITPTDLFYLQSRGLSAQDAEALLIEAFLTDVQS